MSNEAPSKRESSCSTESSPAARPVLPTPPAVTATELLDHGGDFLGRTPRLERLRITETAGLVEALARLPHLAQLVALDLSGNRILPAEARALAQSPHLAGLSRITMHDCGLGDEGLREFAVASDLVHLREWFLTDNGLSDDGLAALADSSRFPELTELSFGHYGVRPMRYDSITRTGLLRLAGSSSLASLAAIHWFELTDRREGPYAQTREEMLSAPRALRLVTHIEQIW